MTRHLLKLIWNRRRTNLLVTIEIFVSFLVLFGVVTLAVFYADNYRRPLGFAYDDVLVVRIAMYGRDDTGLGNAGSEHQQTLRQLMVAAREFPEVIAVAGSSTHPYSDSTWIYSSDVNGLRLRYQVAEATDTLGEVLDVRLVRGRWFGPTDDGAAHEPVVVTTSLSRQVFGDEDPIGKPIPQERNLDGTMPTEMRIVGEVATYRDHGELTSPVNFVFKRTSLDHPKDRPPGVLLLELREGTTAAFEERLVRRFEDIAKGWSFETRPLTEHRADQLSQTVAPLIAVGTVAGFLILMVAMGLTGVLWQTVTQRTREIGVRRAKGASAQRIHRQVLGELALMTTLALVPAVALLVQFPLLDLIGWVEPGVFAASLAISVAAIYLLTMACGWYPSRMATRIQPAEALHYE